MEMAVCRVLVAPEDLSLSPRSPVKAGNGGAEAIPGIAG